MTTFSATRQGDGYISFNSRRPKLQLGKQCTCYLNWSSREEGVVSSSANFHNGILGKCSEKNIKKNQSGPCNIRFVLRYPYHISLWAIMICKLCCPQFWKFFFLSVRRNLYPYSSRCLFFFHVASPETFTATEEKTLLPQWRGHSSSSLQVTSPSHTDMPGPLLTMFESKDPSKLCYSKYDPRTSNISSTWGFLGKWTKSLLQIYSLRIHNTLGMHTTM